MAKKHSDEAEDIALIKSMTVKTNPSVNDFDRYTKGEPRGCVPLERTMKKPDAYFPAKKGPK
jgi:hypothetical protein